MLNRQSGRYSRPSVSLIIFWMPGLGPIRPSRQPLLPKCAQPQSLPPLTSQPVAAKHPRPLLDFVKYLQRLPPRCLLAVIDFAQIQNPSLHHSARGQTPTLLHAPVAVFFPVLLPLVRAQIHGLRALCQSLAPHEKGGGLHYNALWTSPIENSAVVPRPTADLTEKVSSLRKLG